MVNTQDDHDAGYDHGHTQTHEQANKQPFDGYILLAY